MKSALLIFVASLLVSCGHNNSDRPVHQNINPDSIAKIEAYEKNNARNCFKASVTYHKNSIGQWELECTIICNSQMSAFKNVVIDIYYYNESGLVLGSIQKTIEGTFGPNTSRVFNFTEEGSPFTESVGIAIVSATNID